MLRLVRLKGEIKNLGFPPDPVVVSNGTSVGRMIQTRYYGFSAAEYVVSGMTLSLAIWQAKLHLHQLFVAVSRERSVRNNLRLEEKVSKPPSNDANSTKCYETLHHLHLIAVHNMISVDCGLDSF